MGSPRKNSLKIQPNFDKPKLILKKLPSEGMIADNYVDTYNTYQELHPDLDPLSPTSPKSNDSDDDFIHFSSLSERKSVSSLFASFSSQKTPIEDEFEIDLSKKIFFTQKSQIDDVNLYLDSHVFTAKGEIFIVNKLGKIIPKTDVDHDQVTETIDSITQKYTLLPLYFHFLIGFFTFLPAEISILIKNYLTIDESTPLNKQLTPYELKKFTRLTNNRFCNMAEKKMGVDVHSDSLERIFYSGGTGISEPGPYYERKLKKGITALNIRFYEINKINKPLPTETLFMAYNKRFNTEVMTKENLDLFIEELPSNMPAWVAFKQFYHESNMVYLTAEQRSLYELQFTSDGLATVSENHPHKIFDEKNPLFNDRMLANTTNKFPNKKEIHGANTAIYVFHQGKILIARDTLAQFHHSSFADFGVESAGTLRISNEGKILMISNDSGHYRPSERRFHKVLTYLIQNNSLASLEELKITKRVVIRNAKNQMIGTAIRTEVLTDKIKIQDYLKNISSLRYERLKNQLINSPKSPLIKARIAIKKRYFEKIFEDALKDKDSKLEHNKPHELECDNDFKLECSEIPGLECDNDSIVHFQDDKPPLLEWDVEIEAKKNNKPYIEPKSTSPIHSDSSFSSTNSASGFSSLNRGAWQSQNQTPSPSSSRITSSSFSQTPSPSFNKRLINFFEHKHSFSSLHPLSSFPLATVSEHSTTHFKTCEKVEDQMPELEEINHQKKNSKKSAVQLFGKFSLPFRRIKASISCYLKSTKR
ncbi:MAG: hypothetical protein JO131_08570 [Gammaproteobacteria bacterium]|nr:hypothetical protein [Gammaproteobacteria bacterium]